MHGHLFILVGPSGGGKTTLIRHVTHYGQAADAEGENASFVFVPSTTSRPPRPGERDGVDYFFVDEVAFATQHRAAGFLEVQRVHGYHYGSSRTRLRGIVARGLWGITAADILGAFKIKAAMPADVTTVFVTPSRPDILSERIRARGQVSDAELERRLARVAMEMELAYACDRLVLNDDLEGAVGQLRLLAAAQRQQAARLRHFNTQPVVRVIDLAGAPSPEAGSRFCVADCETLPQAALRVTRQWWWEFHPQATRFALPPCQDPSPLAPPHQECGEHAMLEVHAWSACLPTGALR